MARILLLLVRALAALNGTKEWSHLHHHHHHHHHDLSTDHHDAQVHHSAAHNCTESGLAALKCWSMGNGIPVVPDILPSLSIPGSILNTSKGAGHPFSFFSSSSSSPKSTAKSSWLQRRDQGMKKPGPWQLPWQLLGGSVIVVTLYLISAAVLANLIRLAKLVEARLKEKLREHRERRERHEAAEARHWHFLTRRIARVSNDSHRALPARPISNDDFFTIPENMHIGTASTPRDGVVDEEDLERGRPLRRFRHFDLRDPRPELASSSTAQRHWGLFRNLGSSSSSQSQQQRTTNATTTAEVHGESIPMDDIVLTRPTKAVTRNVWRSISGRHARSECTLCEETPSLGEDRRGSGT